MRYNKEGNCDARPRLGYQSKLDYSEIELYVRNNPDLILADIGDKFGISGWHG